MAAGSRPGFFSQPPLPGPPAAPAASAKLKEALK